MALSVLEFTCLCRTIFSASANVSLQSRMPARLRANNCRRLRMRSYFRVDCRILLGIFVTSFLRQSRVLTHAEDGQNGSGHQRSIQQMCFYGNKWKSGKKRRYTVRPGRRNYPDRNSSPLRLFQSIVSDCSCKLRAKLALAFTMFSAEKLHRLSM